MSVINADVFVGRPFADKLVTIDTLRIKARREPVNGEHLELGGLMFYVSDVVLSASRPTTAKLWYAGNEDSEAVIDAILDDSDAYVDCTIVREPAEFSPNAPRYRIPSGLMAEWLSVEAEDTIGIMSEFTSTAGQEFKGALKKIRDAAVTQWYKR